MNHISSDAEWRGQGDIIRNRVTGNGKGDRPRPVNRETFAANWDRIFPPKELPSSS